MKTTEELLTLAGWRLVDEDPPPTPYDRFVDRLGFSLGRELLIDVPDGSAGFDLSVTSAGMEFELRRALCKLFLEFCPAEVCYAISVNHGQWAFRPRDLKLTHHFEPFPVSMTPWAEYVVFGNGDFSHGVFCYPWNEHLVAFGDAFVARLSELHGDRRVAARLAAKSGRAAHRPLAGDG